MNNDSVNAADKGKIKERERDQRFKNDREVDDLKFLLNHPQFRRFIKSLLKECDPEVDMYENSARLHAVYGIQNVGRFIIQKINSADENAMIKIRKEG